MTSYFDEKTREVAEAADDCDDFSTLKTLVAHIELRVIEQVVLVTGDREFPDDLRERILKAIATRAVCHYAGLEPRRVALEYLEATSMSALLDALHSLFHEVARRRIKTRFGLLQDSPRGILVLREEWEDDHYKSLRGE